MIINIELCIKFKTYLVGSSKNIIGGLFTNSRAMESLFFWPPLRFEVIVRRCSDKPRVSRISWICGRIDFIY